MLKSADFLGRLCLSAVFVVAVPSKITKFSSVVEAISGQGIPPALAPFLLLAAIACLVVGSALLLFGKNQKLGASLLLIFLVPTTIIFHAFPFQPKALFMNLGLIGGLTLAFTRSKFIEREVPIDIKE